MDRLCLLIRWALLAALPWGVILCWNGETLGQNSLDDQLFEDLEEDLFSDLDPLPTESDKKQRASSNDEITSDLDRQLQRELGGEDLGQPKKTNPLEEIAQSMRQVRRRIQAQDLATETQQIQGRIVNDLGKLIDLLKKQNQQQQQQSQQNQSQRQQQQQQQQSKPKPQQSNKQPNQPSNKPANQPAKDSKTQQAETQAADTSATRDQMMQDAWGNLPASVQQEMQSARPEKFLPKYSRLIEEYFKRLAEDRKR